jgi:hypothetical protein
MSFERVLAGDWTGSGMHQKSYSAVSVRGGGAYGLRILQSVRSHVVQHMWTIVGAGESWPMGL